MAQGYCYIAGAQVFDGWIQLGESEMTGGGYVGQEVSRMLKNHG